MMNAGPILNDDGKPYVMSSSVVTATRPPITSEEYNSDNLINSINSIGTSWKAGHSTYPFLLFHRINEVISPTDPRIRKSWAEFSKIPSINDTEKNLPIEFDSRLQWPFCQTIREISDQGSCGSCWAVSAVDAMSDRVCIHSKGIHNFRFSASNLINCCFQCGKGCFGGVEKAAWNYWIKFGIVSGGLYKSEQGCQPYEFEPCIGSIENCTDYNTVPVCKKECQSKYGKSYIEDLNFGKFAYSIIKNEKAIMTEIYRNGPVQSFMHMYPDFYVYKSGVYQHIKGDSMRGHAVRIIGWGIDNLTDIPYWLAANSFSQKWGENGYFKIKRGTNECAIEENVTAGIPFFKSN
ncbi:hypothetical protein PGB90_001889 [Kerria lacca]